MRIDNLSRREMLGGAFAAFGGLLLPAGTFPSGTPKLKFGVLSDVHIGADQSGHHADTETRLDKALRWLDEQKVDAVMVPGDIAHSGLIGELRRFAKVWNRHFPEGRARDGRPVERLFVTGNHDLDAWWVKGDDARLSKILFAHGDNPARIWKELFHEEWQPIWKKVVKGYAFIGSQWPTKAKRPPIEDWFREHAAELRGPKPFFYTQHAHPKGTCGFGKISADNGSSTRALSPFPNAVAITGHSHQTLTDESSVWQGVFTSINAGCLRSGDNDRNGVYDSTYPHYSAKRKLDRMKPLDPLEGGCGLLVEVYDDHLIVHRRALAYDCPLGEDWEIALPAAAGGPFDPDNQKRAGVAPEFASGAALKVERCAVAPVEVAGPFLAGKPCVRLTIPHPRAPRAGSRVYDFEVELRVDGATKVKRLILANGYNVPEKLSDRETTCLFGADEVPAQGTVSFAVTPRTSFGVAGRPLASALA